MEIENEKILELEKRIKALEEKLNKITFSEAKEVTMTNCPVGEVHTGDNSSLTIQNASVGSIISDDIDDAEDRLDELESRLGEIIDEIDEVESKLDEMEE